MRRAATLAVLAAALAGALAVRPARSQGEQTRRFSAVVVEYQGTKVWLPSSFIVKAGETVHITLVNKAPSGKHGFAIDAFGVKKEVANDGKPVEVEFKADKAGLYTVYCQLHPAHIGGQLLVLEK